jgi:hypothetical protein
MLDALRRLHPPTFRNESQANALLDQLGASRLDPHRELRGHDFFPPRREMAQVPSIRRARSQAPAERVLRVHYFTAYSDWFVAGFDPRTGWAFGYAEEPDLALTEWGYFDLNFMCGQVIATDPPVVVWRDLEWRPQPARTVIQPDRLAG